MIYIEKIREPEKVNIISKAEAKELLDKKENWEKEKNTVDITITGGMNCHYTGKGAVRQARNRSELENRSNYKWHNKHENENNSIREYAKESAKTARVER